MEDGDPGPPAAVYFNTYNKPIEMADYNFDALTPEDKANIKKELETARQLRGRFHTTPTLPKFSGTDVGRGEVDFETWKYMLTSLVEEQGKIQKNTYSHV